MICECGVELGLGLGLGLSPVPPKEANRSHVLWMSNTIATIQYSKWLRKSPKSSFVKYVETKMFHQKKLSVQVQIKIKYIYIKKKKKYQCQNENQVADEARRRLSFEGNEVGMPLSRIRWNRFTE